MREKDPFIFLTLAQLEFKSGVPNFGVVGPYDRENTRKLTMAFTHRIHMEIFGFFFPPVVKNWYEEGRGRCKEVVVERALHVLYA
jgi:hypothetical protein